MLKRSELGAWLAANPGAPEAWRLIAERAAKSKDPDLWPAGVHPLVAFSLARIARDRSMVEVRRPSPKQELASLDRLSSALNGLREAIDAVPELDGRARPFNLSGAHLPDVTLLLSWRPLQESAVPGLYAASVVDVIEAAQQMLDGTRESLPGRLVGKSKDRPALVAFVRALAGQWLGRGLRPQHRVLAAWASLVLDAAIDAKDVAVVLRRNLTSPKAHRRAR